MAGGTADEGDRVHDGYQEIDFAPYHASGSRGNGRVAVSRRHDPWRLPRRRPLRLPRAGWAWSTTPTALYTTNGCRQVRARISSSPPTLAVLKAFRENLIVVTGLSCDQAEKATLYLKIGASKANGPAIGAAWTKIPHNQRFQKKKSTPG